MLDITLTSDVEKIVGQICNPAQLHTALNRAVTVAAVDARSFMIKACPVSIGYEFKDRKIGRKVGGRLMASLQGGVDAIWKHNDIEMSHTIGSNVKYADAIISQDGKHSGGPYEIRPKRKKFLVFPIGPNTVVRTTKVTHPGAKEIARRKTGKSIAIMTQGKDYVEERADKYVGNAVKRVLKGWV